MADLTTWAAKLDEPPISEIRPVREGRKNLRAGQLMLYPNGRAVDIAVRAIPAGQALSVKALRAALARAHDADITCPVTTGISLRVVAEAAHEAFAAGASLQDVTPIWRVLDSRSPTLRKVSFDPRFVFEQRAREADASAAIAQEAG
jgi:hypothetical protein